MTSTEVAANPRAWLRGAGGCAPPIAPIAIWSRGSVEIATKFAVTLRDCETVRDCGFVSPLRSPLKPVNRKPLLAVACTCTFVDEVKVGPGGFALIVPP